MKKLIPWLICGLALFGMFPQAQTLISNNASDMANHIVMVADSGTPRTVTNLFTFDRDPSAPFAVSASSAKVTNLDADLLDGQTGSYYQTATNLTSGTIPQARMGSGTFTVVSSSTTSNQNNWAPGIVGNTVIFWSGAGDITVTGFAGGVSGLIVGLVNTGSNVATFSHQSGSSSAGNKFRNTSTSGGTPVAAGGRIFFQYDGTDWRLIVHEQGAWITPTFSAGDYTASAGTWTVGSGDVTVLKYRLAGRQLFLNFRVETTDVSTTPATLSRVIPGGFTNATAMLTPIYYEDNGGAGATGNLSSSAASTTLLFSKYSGNWSAATANTRVIGMGSIEVQ